MVVTYQVVGEKMPRHRLEPAGGVTARPLGSKHRRGTLDVNPGADNGWDGALPFHSDFSNCVWTEVGIVLWSTGEIVPKVAQRPQNASQTVPVS